MEYKYYKVVFRDRARELDGISERDYNIPSILLMENAGKEVANVVLSVYKQMGVEGSEVVVIAGSGNNGGDGFCAAKHIANSGAKIKVILVQEEEKIRGDALVNYQIIRKMKIPIFRVDSPSELRKILPQKGIIIDSIFGTGLAREIEDKFLLEVIKTMNEWRCAKPHNSNVSYFPDEFRRSRFIISVDIPSGLDSDTGMPRPICVDADITVTFAPAKVGLFIGEAQVHVGDVKVVDIGIPLELWKGSDITLLYAQVARSFVRPRDPLSHKGSFGHLLCVCGGVGRAGAAVLVGKGAIRSGAGLVTILTPDSVYIPVALGAREYMVIPAPSDGRSFSERASELFDEFVEGRSAVVVGPGIWTYDGVRKFLFHILRVLSWRKVPCVLDADALNILAELGHNWGDMLRSLDGRVVITPHPGEAARLLGSSTSDVQKDRVRSALRLNEISGAVVLLKGARTIITDGKEIYINMEGGVELATGGTGDVLTGVIGGLLAQVYSPLHAACVGAVLHGIAGKMISEGKGFPLSPAEEVANNIDRAFARLFDVG